MDFREKFEVIIGVIVLVAVVGALLNLPQNLVNLIISWLLSIGVGVILSGICGELIEAFTGDFFKQIFVNIEVWKFHFSIPLFVILTFGL